VAFACEKKGLIVSLVSEGRKGGRVAGGGKRRGLPYHLFENERFGSWRRRRRGKKKPYLGKKKGKDFFLLFYTNTLGQSKREKKGRESYFFLLREKEKAPSSFR